MHNSKLIQALRRLSGRQLSRFSDFVSSPYFNKKEDIRLFFKYLQKYAPEYTDKKLEKKFILKKVDFVKNEDSKKLAALMSQLLALLEKFLIVEQMDQRQMESWLTLATNYHELSLSKHYQAVINKAGKWLEQQPLRNADFHLYQFLLKKSLYQQGDSTKRTYNPQLQEASDALDQFYVLEKLRFSCEMLNYEKTLNINYQPLLKPHLADLLKHPPFADHPVSHIYCQLLELLDDLENIEVYYDLKNRIAKHAELFSVEEKKYIYTILLNFCTRRITKLHDTAFEREYFLLNIDLLDRKLLLENGELSPWRYSNLVTVGLRMGEMEWAWQFIHDNKKLLPKAYAENLFQYKTGQYFYHSNQLEEAQLALHKVELKDPFLALSVKNLLSKIYYESGQTELLLSFLEAYRIAILRDKLTQPELKEQLRHFIDATRKLAKLPAFEKEKLQQLKSTLPSEKEMMHRDWVEKMIDKKIQESSRF